MKKGIINTAYTNTYGKEDGYRRMRLHGYSFADFQGFMNTETDFFRSDLRNFENSLLLEKKIAEQEGIIFSQAHGPWRHPPRDLSVEDRAERMEAMKRSIYGTTVLGCKKWVIHPLMPFGSNSPERPEEMVEINREFFSRICDYAKELDVTVCFENMPFSKLPLASVDQILGFIRDLNRDNFKMCLDTGHCAVLGDRIGDAVKRIGHDLLAVLHIHDNDGTRDTHMHPSKGVLDWTDFSRSLNEIGFDGAFSLECAPIRDKDHPETNEARELELAQLADKILHIAE